MSVLDQGSMDDVESVDIVETAKDVFVAEVDETVAPRFLALDVTHDVIVMDSKIPETEINLGGTRTGRDLEDAAEQLALLIAERGGVVVRHTGIESAQDVERFAAALGTPLTDVSEESSPRTKVSQAVWTSTDYPARFPIQFHNEFSYASEWPRLVLFCCLEEPSRGGQTGVASSCGVLELLRPSTRSEFRERGLLYERNYSPLSGVGWQSAFGTDDRAAVERHCLRRNIDWVWSGDDRLTTRQTAPAIARHPRRDQSVWFNHCLLFNVAGLEPDWLREVFERQPPELRASNSYFGDGEDIPRAHLDEVREAYSELATFVEWSRGDVLVIDNMLMAHARAPYEGARRVLVSMIDRWSRAECT